MRKGAAGTGRSDKPGSVGPAEEGRSTIYLGRRLPDGSIYLPALLPDSYRETGPAIERCLVFQPTGFTSTGHYCPAAWALTPRFHPYPGPRPRSGQTAVCFLLHYSVPLPKKKPRPLAGVVPCVARTFLLPIPIAIGRQAVEWTAASKGKPFPAPPGFPDMKTAVIGAGIAGLAAAVRLAAAGHAVDVYEANEGPGGKLSQFTLPGGYRFDFGPSLFTMPQYVDELFTLAGEDPREHFNYVRLPEVCRYWWPDGTQFTAPASTADLISSAAKTFDVPEQAMQDFMDTAARKYELTGRTFLEKSLHKLSTWLDPQVAFAMLKIPGLDLFKSMHDVHEAALKDPRLVQLFDRFATYNGSNPYKAPGLLSMIPHFEHHFGAYLPEGGMYDIADSIYNWASGWE